jgi:hypothetical protein
MHAFGFEGNPEYEAVALRGVDRAGSEEAPADSGTLFSTSPVPKDPDSLFPARAPRRWANGEGPWA